MPDLTFPSVGMSLWGLADKHIVQAPPKEFHRLSVDEIVELFAKLFGPGKDD
jgi:hypothetical protein